MSFSFTSSSNEQLKENFKKDGFIYIPGFLGKDELNNIKTILSKVINEKVPLLPPEAAFYEDPAKPETLKQIQRLFDLDEGFNSIMFYSKFTELASLLLGDSVVGKNMQYFNKPPMVGKPTPPHQDGYYFMLEPNEAITIWLGLDDVDEENGCVRYVRGSHLMGMRPHTKTNTLGFSQGIVDYGTLDDKKNEVWFNTKPGDLLAHHSLTIHRADGNNSSDRSRKAIGLIYYASKAIEDLAAKEQYQENLKNEIRIKAASINL